MSTKSTIRRSIAVAALALAFPAVAGAIPVDDDDQPPFNAAPVARFTITPNPALYSPLPEVQARARAFGPDSIYRSGDIVKFDGAGSTDDGEIVKYEYDLDGNGTYEISGTSPKAARRYASMGTYTIRLRVTDDGNKSRVVTHSLIVHAPPRARLTANTNLALVGQTVELDGATSSDADGIVKYEFDLDGDGTFEKVGSATASTAFTSLGEHLVRLRVTDAYGATGTDVQKIVVHRAPTAAFTFAPNPGVAGEAIALDGSGSSDDGTIAKYEWDLDGDGTFETDTQGTPSATATFATPGTYTVKLRVTDDHGVQDAVSHQLTVNAKAETTVDAADVDAPLVRVLTRSAKLRRGSIVRVKVACPATETACTGRLVLRTPRKVLGRKAFSLAGGQQKVLTVRIAKNAVKRRLTARAVATATDAAGNSGTTRKIVTIKR